MLYEEKTIETIPVGPLGLIPLKSWRASTSLRLHFPDIRESPISLGPAHRVSVPERRRERFPSRFAETIYTSWWMYVITA